MATRKRRRMMVVVVVVAMMSDSGVCIFLWVLLERDLSKRITEWLAPTAHSYFCGVETLRVLLPKKGGVLGTGVPSIELQ